MQERVAEAFSSDEHLTVIGRKLQAGEVAPDFLLDYVDLIDMTVHRARLADSAGTVRILSIINSLDMPICRLQTLHWEQLRSSLPPNVYLYTISMDLPRTQAYWQVQEAVLHQALSAHRNEQFGRDYGILLKEWRLLQRTVFILNCDDTIIYAEYVADQQHEPNYQAAIGAISRLTSP
jgi:thiol peroxidase